MPRVFYSNNPNHTVSITISWLRSISGKWIKDLANFSNCTQEGSFEGFQVNTSFTFPRYSLNSCISKVRPLGKKRKELKKAAITIRNSIKFK